MSQYDIADEIVERIEERVDVKLANSPIPIQAILDKTGMTLEQVRSYLVVKAIRDLTEMRYSK